MSTPQCVNVGADVDLNESRELGELSEDEQGVQPEAKMKTVAGSETENNENGDMPYDRFSYYVARSLAERLVLEYPPIPRPAQGFKLRDPPNPKVTLITDRVGIQWRIQDFPNGGALFCHKWGGAHPVFR